MRRASLLLMILHLAPSQFAAGQDTTSFDPRVLEPAYPTDAPFRPRVLIDAGHFNTHTPSGSYRAFTELIRNDGYSVTVGTGSFESPALDGHDVVIIATPQPFLDSLVNWSDSVITRANWTSPALTERECDAIQAWVNDGGALLLITGHAPRAFWSATLAGRFGVDVHNSYAADSLNSERASETMPRGAWIVYSRDNGLLADHAITNGRSQREQVRRVRVNGSASLSGPPGSTAFLQLGPSAYEWIFHDFAFWEDARHSVVSIPGRSQGVAFRFGAGRVVVLAPTALFSERYMARPDTDHRQLALNVMHWLSGLTDP